MLQIVLVLDYMYRLHDIYIYDMYAYECIIFKINLLFPLRVSEKSIVSCAFARGVGAGRCRCWCALTVT